MASNPMGALNSGLNHEKDRDLCVRGARSRRSRDGSSRRSPSQLDRLRYEAARGRMHLGRQVDGGLCRGQVLTTELRVRRFGRGFGRWALWHHRDGLPQVPGGVDAAAGELVGQARGRWLFDGRKHVALRPARGRFIGIFVAYASSFHPQGVKWSRERSDIQVGRLVVFRPPSGLGPKSNSLLGRGGLSFCRHAVAPGHFELVGSPRFRQMT